MKILTPENPYEERLIRLMHSIENEIKMERGDIIGVLILLETEEMITEFFHWVESKMNGETLEATGNQVLQAAVRINEGRTDLP